LAAVGAPGKSAHLAAGTRRARDAAYIANWLEVLKADHRAIFVAASHAQRAANFINGLQPASGG